MGKRNIKVAICGEVGSSFWFGIILRRECIEIRDELMGIKRQTVILVQYDNIDLLKLMAASFPKTKSSNDLQINKIDPSSPKIDF